MLSNTLLSAMLLAAFATSALAEERPTYDTVLEAQIIDHLQAKLPPLRSAFGLKRQARILTEEQKEKQSWMSRIAVDGIRSYPGRIVWL